MRRVTMLLGVLLITACGGDRKEDTPPGGAAAPSPSRDTATRVDSVSLRGDSMMARDTARPE